MPKQTPNSALLFWPDASTPDDKRQAAAGRALAPYPQSGYRNAAAFKPGDYEPCDVVYTDSPAIRAMYEAQGVTVYDLPREQEPPKPAKPRTRKPKA